MLNRYGVSCVLFITAMFYSLTGAAQSLPGSGLLATFKVGNETFKSNITSPASINDAILVWRGKSNKKIPVGQLSCTAAGWNSPWHWQQLASTVVMAHSTVEVCDGAPSYVEAHCSTFGGGYYCPWMAIMIDLRDCRTSSLCPRVSK